MLAVDRPAPPPPSRHGLPSEISLESIVQRHAPSVPRVARIRRAPPRGAVILITYATTEDAVRKALAAIEQDKVCIGTPQVIRIEKN